MISDNQPDSDYQLIIVISGFVHVFLYGQNQIIRNPDNRHDF
jgi:hypothetical protein